MTIGFQAEGIHNAETFRREVRACMEAERFLPRQIADALTFDVEHVRVVRVDTPDGDTTWLDCSGEARDAPEDHPESEWVTRLMLPDDIYDAPSYPTGGLE